MQTECTNSVFREGIPYNTRNSSKGALIDEAYAVFAALRSGSCLEAVREEALAGKLLRQRSGQNRRRIWELIRKRYLLPEISWLHDAVCDATAQGSESASFRSLLYLLYSLHDRLTYDFVTVLLCHSCNRDQVVTRHDVLDFLDNATDGQAQIRRWTEATKSKLAGSILTALRDFGVLAGKQKKVLAVPVLPTRTAEIMLRILTCEGVRGRAALENSIWRLFLLSQNDVVAVFGKLAQERAIRFEKTGSVVVLDTPPEWEVSCVES